MTKNKFNRKHAKQVGKPDIASILPIGKERAIPTKHLVELTGCKSARELQQYIAVERKAGAVILSTCQDGGGYYLPANRGEIAEFAKTLENRATNTFIALKSARKALKETEGQLTIVLSDQEVSGE